MAGVVLIIGAVCWWQVFGGELIDSVDLQKSGRLFFGDIVSAASDAGRGGKVIGPYMLTPADNPVRVSVAVGATSLKPGAVFPEAEVRVAMCDSSGAETWAEVALLPQMPQMNGSAEFLRQRGVRAGVRENAFESVTITRPGKYTFCCGIKTVPGDWAEAHKSEFGVMFAIRRRARAFPTGFVVAGIVLAGVGCVLLQVSGGAREAGCVAGDGGKAGGLGGK